MTVTRYGAAQGGAAQDATGQDATGQDATGQDATGRPRTSAEARRRAAPPEALDGDPVVTAVMSAGPVVITAETRVPTALHLMAAHGVRHLPVLDSGRCRGVVVEGDLVRCLAAAPGPPTGHGLTSSVSGLVRRARAVPATGRVSEAARRMADDGSDAVLVVDGGRLLGIVTATDLVRLVARFAVAHPTAPDT